MSETTDFYMSWLGGNAFGNTPSAPPAKPKIFTPLDISDCSIWFNGNDLQTIDQDAEGAVLSIKNQGSGGSRAFKEPTNPSDITVGTFVNNLNCINIPAGTNMVFTVTLPYQSRTSFIVFQPTSDYSAIGYPYTIFLAGGLAAENSGFGYSAGNYNYYLAVNGIGFPISANSSTDISGAAHYVTYIVDGTNINGSSVYLDATQLINNPDLQGNAFDTGEQTYIINNGAGGAGPGMILCEMIQYGRKLDQTEIDTIWDYLRAKWNLVTPLPPPPPLLEPERPLHP